MDEIKLTRLENRLVDQIRLAGLSRDFTWDERSEIPQIWEAFDEIAPTVAGKVPGCFYGVSYNGNPEGFSYAAAVELLEDAPVPDLFTEIPIPTQKCAVFETQGPISDFPKAMGRAVAALNADAHFAIAEGPPMVEVYDERFNPRDGIVTILIPVVERG
ncbi:GyrI-like domain-containing protein [Celeribacter arenosi]